MAAIDKIYVKNFYQYDDLLKWSLIYYPKLLLYFYNIHMTYEEFEKSRRNYVKNFKESTKKELEKIGGRVKLQKAVKNLKKHYKETANYEASNEQCYYEAKDILRRARMSRSQIENSFSMPITNTPFEIDTYLKWHCPLSFVRKYLHNNCGVNPKWDKFYKLWWKGKKEFYI